MIQLPRTLKPESPSLRGLDVLAYKRTIRQWETATGRKGILNWPPSPVYGAGAVEAVRQFQAARSMKVDGVFGLHTYSELYPLIDAYDLSLIKLYVKRHPILTGRDEVVAQLKWLIANHLSVFYAMTRPVLLARFRDHLLPITSDCSGSIIGANFAAGAPDPSGDNYDGEGNTASFLTHLEHIDRISLRPADIVVFGAYPGEHAVAIMDMSFNIYTHGHTGLPDDPRIMPLTDMESFFVGEGITSVSYLRVALA